MASFEAGPCGVPPFCTLHRFAPGPATARTDDANQADHTDEARRHAPSIANLRSQRRPLRPKHPLFGASGRGGLHVEHNTNNPPHNPVPIGGFYYHRTPMTACRRRVAALWSQFPPDNKNKRGNRARQHALHRLGSTTPLCGTLLWFLRNVARNSPTRISSFEITSLELQRFEGVAESSGTRITCEFWVVRRVDRIPMFGRRPNTLFMVPGTHQPACISADPHRIMDQRAQTAPARQHDHMHQLKYRLSRTRKPKSRTTSNTQCPIIPKLAQPTRIPTFPHQKAEKSLQNQHVLSILQVGSHQLQYRFFRINNPKSRTIGHERGA